MNVVVDIRYYRYESKVHHCILCQTVIRCTYENSNSALSMGIGNMIDVNHTRNINNN